jgi:hypothetical protein
MLVPKAPKHAIVIGKGKKDVRFGSIGLYAIELTKG